MGGPLDPLIQLVCVPAATKATVGAVKNDAKNFFDQIGNQIKSGDGNFENLSTVADKAKAANEACKKTATIVIIVIIVIIVLIPIVGAAIKLLKMRRERKAVELQQQAVALQAQQATATNKLLESLVDKKDSVQQ
jgi:flagellar biosynthesis/type III secretory pathway M-ring protein FliF/YscJ